jgi:hypothetical protein
MKTCCQIMEKEARCRNKSHQIHKRNPTLNECEDLRKVAKSLRQIAARLFYGFYSFNKTLT